MVSLPIQKSTTTVESFLAIFFLVLTLYLFFMCDCVYNLYRWQELSRRRRKNHQRNATHFYG
jgi:hypothetical protein